jgi:hypothetical protein
MAVDDDVPGFAVPVGGYGPSAEGIVPVNCTSVGGSTDCVAPTGRTFSKPSPPGFPAAIDPTQPNYHSYHLQSEPLAMPPEKLQELVMANPTPNFLLGRAATPEGTLNEATPDVPYAIWSSWKDVPAGTPFNQVSSYVAKDRAGNPMVVNVTEPGHALFPGYTILYVTSADGKSRIHVEGEGLAKAQAQDAPERQRVILNDATWKEYFNQIARRAR